MMGPVRRDAPIFRRLVEGLPVWGNGITEKVIWHVVKNSAANAGIAKLSPHDCRRYAASRTMPHESVSAVLVALYATSDAA